MTKGPETRYAKTADGLDIAYHVTGEGPPDLITAAGGVSHLEVYGEYGPAVRWGQRLASFARLITFDKRGTGLSDPVPLGQPPTLEERMDDLRAVMDAVGVERAALLGMWEGNAMAALFAATYPQRVTGLILYSPLMRFTWAADYPWAPTTEMQEDYEASIEDGTNDGLMMPLIAPSVADDATFRAWWPKLQRFGGTPGQRLAFQRMNAEIDVRAVLSSIRVPTLVLHRKDDALIPVEAGHWVASQIQGAKFAVLAGRDTLPFVGDFEEGFGEIEEFLTGSRSTPMSDRVLATVLFTDIVGSTDRLAAMGDQRWRSVLAEHDTITKAVVGQHRGRLIKTTGDGLLATFDGPGRAIRCASALVGAVKPLGIQIRAGLHTGEIEVLGEDVGGIAVHIAARVVDLAATGQVLVSSTVKDLVAGSGIEFGDRGDHELKGVPATWKLFAVEA